MYFAAILQNPQTEEASDGATRKDKVNASVADYLVSILGFSEWLDSRGRSIYPKQLFHMSLVLILVSIGILNTVFKDGNSYLSTNW